MKTLMRVVVLTVVLLSIVIAPASTSNTSRGDLPAPESLGSYTPFELAGGDPATEVIQPRDHEEDVCVVASRKIGTIDYVRSRVTGKQYYIETIDLHRPCVSSAFSGPGRLERFIIRQIVSKP